MSDLFHKRVSDAWIAAVYAQMETAQHHQFQVLTKRPERMARLLTPAFYAGPVRKAGYDILGPQSYIPRNPGWPLPNVWHGVSVENQDTAHARIPWLLKTPAAVRFLSCEPLLGPIQLRVIRVTHTRETSQTIDALYGHGHWYTGELGFCPRLDWVIVGGESGPSHRPMDLAWLTDIVDQSRAAGVPVFVKQNAGRYPGNLEGIPMEYRMQEFPSVDAHRRPGQQGRIPAAYWVQEFPERKRAC